MVRSPDESGGMSKWVSAWVGESSRASGRKLEVVCVWGGEEASSASCRAWRVVGVCVTWEQSKTVVLGEGGWSDAVSHSVAAVPGGSPASQAGVSGAWGLTGAGRAGRVLTGVTPADARWRDMGGRGMRKSSPTVRKLELLEGVTVRVVGGGQG